MSVIIRLQNLSWSANSLDIRQFFRGLSIPEGGVHIVGGEMGDAFIAFSTDEDARQAMMKTGGKIKEVQISLMLSSRNEMQKVIEAARQATNSFAHLLGAQQVPPGLHHLQQQPQQTPQLPIHLQQQHHNFMGNNRRDSQKDSSDLSTSSYDTVRRDKKEKSRSRSRDRMRKDRRDRDRDRDRRRRSRSRSRSRDRRRRRSHSRSRGRDTHGRDRDRKDPRDDMKKDMKDMGPGGVNSLQDATNLPNMDILNQNQWRMMAPGGLPQNAPVISSLTNLDILRNFAGAKPLLQTAALAGAGVPPLLGNVDMGEGENRFQGMPGNDDMGYGGRGRGGDFSNGGNRRDNRDAFNRDGDMNGGNSRDGMGPDGGGRGNFRNFDDGNQTNFQGNFPYGDGNVFDMATSFGNMAGYQQRNGGDGMNNPNRFGSAFSTGDNMPGMMGNANRDQQRGLMDYPLSMQNDNFNKRNDRYDSRDDRVDEFGRSIQLRNRGKRDDSYKDDDFPRNQQGNFQGFQNRFGGGQGSGPQPLLGRGRDSWPPNRQGDNFNDRRGFRGGYDEGSRSSFRSDFSDGSRQGGRSRRDDFHNRDRNRFSDKGSRDDCRYDRDCCVEIRGLAPSTAYGDVRRPFNNLKVVIKDIKFFDYTKTEKKCRLKFLNYENKKKALQNPKKIMIDGKQAQLLHINDAEFDECVDEGVRRNDPKFSDDEDDLEFFIQIRDLLPEHVEEDVTNLLAPAETEKVVLETSQDGKSKTALIKFVNTADTRAALATPGRKIGEHDVTLASISQREFNERVRRVERPDEVTTTMMIDPEVCLIGEKGDDGEGASGRVQDVELHNVDDDDDEEEDDGERGRRRSERTDEMNFILIKNLPLEVNDRDLCDFFSDVGLVPKKIHLMLDSQGEPTGEAYCEFDEAEQAKTACSKNDMPMGKNNLVVERATRAEVMSAIGTRGESGASGGSADSSKAVNPDGFGKPNCVVAVENIPFRAGVFDIINFFGWSYKLSEEDVRRKYNDRGQATGDARVAFHSPEDALKAVRFLNNRNLMGRNIRMKIL